MNWLYPHSRILIFCKAPIPGKVKTRLMPDLSADKACTVHRRLSEQTLRVAINSKLAPVHIYAGLDASHKFFNELKSIGDYELYEQKGKDLGDRMWHALFDTFKSGRGPAIQSAVLIGTDCPVMSVEHLSEAVGKLHTDQAVITPMEDGGYGLIGFSAPDYIKAKVCFTEMPWGTDQVFDETMKRLKSEAVFPFVMNTLWDVDDFYDLQRCFTTSDPEIWDRTYLGF